MLFVLCREETQGMFFWWGSMYLQVEADTFGCLSKLLDGIQDHYTFAQPGIQRLVFRFKELVRRIDGALFILFYSQCTTHTFLMFLISNVDGLMQHFVMCNVHLISQTEMKNSEDKMLGFLSFFCWYSNWKTKIYMFWILQNQLLSIWSRRDLSFSNFRFAG